MKIRDLTLGAMFLAIALTVFVIENQIPLPLPIPGLKIGLSNIVTLITLYLWDKKYSFGVLMLRVIISSVICGSGITILYSLSGGIVCFFVMLILKSAFSGKAVPAVSIIGAISHNIAQLSVAALILNSGWVFVYLPVLCALGIIAGAFTGIIGLLCIKNKNISNLFSGGAV